MDQRMNIYITPELQEYMRRKGKRHISVEVASADHSDFDVTELYFRIIDDRTVSFLKKKRYRAVEAGEGYVMLPPYHLQYDENVTFRLKKVLVFHTVTADGIRL